MKRVRVKSMLPPIRRPSPRKYHDELMAASCGRQDDAHPDVVTTLIHYGAYKIASENEDTLEFVSSVGDRILSH